MAAKRTPILPRATVHGPETLTRKAAAKILGCSVSLVRKLEGRGRLVPHVVEGVHYHQRGDVQRLALELAQEQPRGAATGTGGELAAEAFRLLEGGRPALELVTVLRLAPKAAEDLVAAFKRLRGLTVGAVRGVPQKHDAPPTDAPMCASCGEACARYCAGCVSPRRPPSAAPETE